MYERTQYKGSNINFFTSKKELNLYITPYLKEELSTPGGVEILRGNMHKSLRHGIQKYLKFLNYICKNYTYDQ